MKEARRDGDNAWLAYDTLYVNGRAVKDWEFAEGELNILSWNVNGLTSTRKDDDEFVNILSKYDLIFLYETWTSSKSNVELSGYTAHTFYRQFEHRNARRYSDGLVLYYKDSLKDGISIVKNQYDTII